MRRFRVDSFLVLILCTVGFAAVLPASGMWAEGVGRASVVAIGLLFFLYGARLSTREAIDGLRNWRLHGLVVGVTFVVFPLLGLAFLLVPDAVLPLELKLGLLFLCCLPSTVQSSIAFTSVARGNVPAAICAASLSNLLGVLITPLLTGLLLAAQGGVSGDAVLKVALQLLAPFVLGQLLRRWIGDWVARHAAVLKIVDRGSILLVVYVAFSAGMTEGIWGRLSPLALGALVVAVLVLLGVVLGLSHLLPRALGLPRGDRITVLMCGSTKSLASGLPMASVLFVGGGVGLLVLPLMLFHQLQLVACAVIAGRAARAPVPVSS